MLASKGRKALVVFLLFFLPIAFGVGNKNFLESQLLKGGKSFERLQIPQNRTIAPAKLFQSTSSHRDLKRGGEVPICTAPNDQWFPAIYGDKIVWEDFRNGNADIYMYDLSTGKERAICTDPNDQEYPAIYGDKIVWEDWHNWKLDIYMYDFSTGKERAICTDPNDQEYPAIYGDKIVWIDNRNGNFDIYMYQLSEVTLVTLVKSVDETSANIGDTLTYTLTYKNESSETIENITITDTLPVNVEYISGSATGGGSYDSNSKTLTWKIATLNPGQEGSVSFKVKIVSGTEISNKATLSAPSYSIESNTTKTTVSSVKLPWSFAISTDIHMGRNIYSSREEGGLKEIPLPNYLVDRLTKALENIKKLKDKENIQFDAVLGDISDSGEEGELKKAKEILDEFQGESGIPYIPLLGNHDLWAYCNDNGILHPAADRNISYFPGVFKNQFEALKGMLQKFKL